MREYKYRRLFPITHDQYLDTPVDEIEWKLRVAELHGDQPWNNNKRRGPGGPDAGSGAD